MFGLHSEALISFVEEIFLSQVIKSAVVEMPLFLESVVPIGLPSYLEQQDCIPDSFVSEAEGTQIRNLRIDKSMTGKDKPLECKYL